jgi:recombination protein RecT
MATPAQIVPRTDALSSMVDMLQKLKPQMRAALPKHLSPERMARIVTTTLRRTPKLLECTPVSLAGAIIQSCQLGLEPDGFLGEFYLTPRRIQGIWNVVGIPGWRGLAKLARQSGEVDWIVAHVVYEGDEFRYEYGTEPKLIHKPGEAPHEDARITYAYATARLRTGSNLFWAMNRADINKVRDQYASARDDGPWITHFPEMASKTPLRRLCKHLPQSPALGRAVALDEAAEAGLPQGLEALVDTAELGLPSAPTTTLDRLGEAMESARPSAAGAEAGTRPVTHAPASRPPGRRGRFPRLPQDVEVPARAPEPAPAPQEATDPTGEPALDPDAPSHAFAPRSERMPEITPSNCFDLIRAAQDELELDHLVEHVHASAVYRGWGESDRQIFRDAVNLTRKRLPAA